MQETQREGRWIQSRIRYFSDSAEILLFSCGTQQRKLFLIVKLIEGCSPCNGKTWWKFLNRIRLVQKSAGQKRNCKKIAEIPGEVESIFFAATRAQTLKKFRSVRASEEKFYIFLSLFFFWLKFQLDLNVTLNEDSLPFSSSTTVFSWVVAPWWLNLMSLLKSLSMSHWIGRELGIRGFFVNSL